MRFGFALLVVVLASGCVAPRPGAEPIGWFTDHWICDGCANPAPIPPPPAPVVPPAAAGPRRGG